VRHSRWQRQDGFIRELIRFAAVIVILGVLVLDTFSVINTSLAVRQNATDAAKLALSTYVSTGRPGMALTAASGLLKLHDATLVMARSKLTPATQAQGQTVVTITASKQPHTYVFHYFQKLPWGIGRWFHKILNPISSQTSS
jgi:hypothetical protein